MFFKLISDLFLLALLLYAFLVRDWIHVAFIAPLFVSQLFLSYKNILPKIFLFLFPFIALLATLGSEHTLDYYRTIDWYDKMLHLVVVFLITYFFNFLADFTTLKEVRKQLWVFVFVIIGWSIATSALWEIFEWVFFSILPLDRYWEEGIDDLATDLVFDSIGALLAGVIIFYKEKHSSI